MAKLHHIVLATTAAAFVVGGLMSAPADAKCVRAGGQATMITEDLAKFMAGAALKNSIAGMGAKPVGPVVDEMRNRRGPADLRRQAESLQVGARRSHVQSERIAVAHDAAGGGPGEVRADHEHGLAREFAEDAPPRRLGGLAS